MASVRAARTRRGCPVRFSTPFAFVPLLPVSLVQTRKALVAKQLVQVQAFEVKFVLNPARVLSPGGAPAPEVAAALGVTGAVEEYRVAFLDGPHLDFHTERWNVRFRDKGGKR